MGRPLKKSFFGNPANPGSQLVLTSAWIPGAVGLSSSAVTIIRQVGTGRYEVTDGTNTGVVRLVGFTPTVAGEATLTVTPFGGGATEHARVIFDRTVKTWESHVYDWSVNAATAVGQADLPLA